MDPKIHKLITIEDIQQVITPDNFECFIKDFTTYMATFMAVRELTKDKSVKIESDWSVFHWIDDGKNDIDIKLKIKTESHEVPETLPSVPV
jgi:hypothetical protein